MEAGQVAYVSECLRFIFFSTLLYGDTEQEIKGFFCKQRAIFNGKQKQDDEDVRTYEQFLNACVFFSGASVIRVNALRALFVTVFQPVMLGIKVSKEASKR
jgi:hypothetical protein